MNEASNPFDAFAEAVKPNWARTRERATAKAAQTRAKTAAEKALDEEEILTKLWERGERQRRADLLAGPFGAEIKALVAFMRGMTLEDADRLVGYVRGCTWMGRCDDGMRHRVLGVISDEMRRLAKREGYPDGFDDALWDEPPRAHQILRDIVRAA